MIDRRRFLQTSGVGLAGLWLGSAFADAAVPQEKPNLLFIFTDDQRSDAIGYANSFMHTPNLDRLAAQGMRFNNAFITLPVCTPARATALTGRYGMANGVCDYAGDIKDTERSFADYLGGVGYFTAMVGKWHIHGRSPANFGFQEVRQLGNMAPYWNPSVIENGKRREYAGYSTDYCAEQSIDLIKQAQATDQPFCLWLCTQAPHDRGIAKGGSWMRKETRELYTSKRDALTAPPNADDDLHSKPPYLKTYRGRRKMMAKGPITDERYRDNRIPDEFGQITELDNSLGKLFAALDEMNLRDNTYIIFLSDNGLFRGEHGFMSKALHYEESIRVPMFVVGPGVGRGQCDEMVTNADIAPTLLDLAGVDIPVNMHGQSLKSVVLDEKPLDRSALLFELPEAIEGLETRPAYTVRTDRYKYIQTYEDGKNRPYTFEELYDLQNDRYEMNNLIDRPEHAQLIAQLREQMESLRQQYGK